MIYLYGGDVNNSYVRIVNISSPLKVLHKNVILVLFVDIVIELKISLVYHK